MKYERYTNLAELFVFPGPEYALRARSLVIELREKYPKAAAEIQRFVEGIPEKTLDMQELYTRTFDVQSLTTLDVGYVLFGDDYKREELLANLNREHLQADNDCRGELADHLPNVLRLIPLLPRDESGEGLVAELVSDILVPALMLMIREFDSERIEKKNASYKKHYKTLIDSAPGNDLTIYCRTLKALLEVLTVDFNAGEIVTKISDWSSRPQTADFLGLVEREMEIETNANPVNSGCDT